MHTHVYKHRNVSKQTFHMFVYEHGSRIRTRFAYTKVEHTYTNIVHVYKQIAYSYTNNVHVYKQLNLRIQTLHMYVYEQITWTYTHYISRIQTITICIYVLFSRIRTFGKYVYELFPRLQIIYVYVYALIFTYTKTTVYVYKLFSRIQTMHVYMYGLFFTYTNNVRVHLRTIFHVYEQMACAYTNYIPRIRMSYICIISSLDSHI